MTYFFGIDADTVPSWAKQWCYIFLVLAFVALLPAILGLFQVRRFGLAFTILFLLVSLIQATTYCTLFWMCRSSLRNA